MTIKDESLEKDIDRDLWVLRTFSIVGISISLAVGTLGIIEGNVLYSVLGVGFAMLFVVGYSDAKRVIDNYRGRG